MRTGIVGNGWVRGGMGDDCWWITAACTLQRVKGLYQHVRYGGELVVEGVARGCDGAGWQQQHQQCSHQ